MPLSVAARALWVGEHGRMIARLPPRRAAPGLPHRRRLHLGHWILRWAGRHPSPLPAVLDQAQPAADLAPAGWAGGCHHCVWHQGAGGRRPPQAGVTRPRVPSASVNIKLTAAQQVRKRGWQVQIMHALRGARAGRGASFVRGGGGGEPASLQRARGHGPKRYDEHKFAERNRWLRPGSVQCDSETSEQKEEQNKQGAVG